MYNAPDVDVDLPAHGAGLDLEPAGVAGHVTVTALHDRRQRDTGTHLHTAVITSTVQYSTVQYSTVQ